MRNPHAVTEEFEQALCEYTGAPFACAVNSCTAALMLAVAWHIRNSNGCGYRGWDDEIDGRPAIEIPSRTYVSVPMSIIHAGGRPTFRDEEWLGMYQLKPLSVFDSARYFTTDLYRIAETRRSGNDAPFVCASFHASKTLGIEQGGAILHSSAEAQEWFKRARFDGRTPGVAPKDDHFDMIGFHCYLNPSTAAQGLVKMHSLPRHNAPLPNDDYPDLSKLEIFR